MTELSSQRWDSVLYDRFHGRSLAPRRLLAPPWLRTRVLDPDTLAPVAPGGVGLLCHHDLANAGSVSVVLTEDLGRTVGDDGIEVTGRVAGATPRGCGALLEALGVTLEAPDALARRIARAVDARAALARRPLRETIAALAAAAARWRDDAALAGALPEVARLHPTMVHAILPLAAAALDAGAMTALVERELGAGAAGRPAPAGPAVIVHVMAGNVPALALPAASLGCLAGAAVVLKSGRGDPLSAPAFVRALDAVDPALAATVVATYWPGGDLAREAVALGGADVVVATGGEPALAALRGRVRGRLLTHGPRMSVVAVTGDADAAAVARDVVLYEQRGCLSPQAVWVAGEPRAFAARLATALDDAAVRLPPAPATVEERAAARVVRDEASWNSGAAVWSGPGGSVLYEPDAAFRPTGGMRTVRVHGLPALDALASRLPAGVVECVAIGGADPHPLLPALRARGVARLCLPGRMQEPPLAWPRGQLAPLGALLGREEPPRCEVDP